MTGCQLFYNLYLKHLDKNKTLAIYGQQDENDKLFIFLIYLIVILIYKWNIISI